MTRPEDRDPSIRAGYVYVRPATPYGTLAGPVYNVPRTYRTEFAAVEAYGGIHPADWPSYTYGAALSAPRRVYVSPR